MVRIGRRHTIHCALIRAIARENRLVRTMMGVDHIT
jgi:hypothetical protein